MLQRDNLTASQSIKIRVAALTQAFCVSLSIKIDKFNLSNPVVKRRCTGSYRVWVLSAESGYVHMPISDTVVGVGVQNYFK